MMERSEEEEGEEEEEEEENDEVLENAMNGHSPLDPRAGSVDVELPLISFDARNIVKLLQEHRLKKYTNAKTRKGLTDLIGKFSKLAEGEYPLGMKEVPELPDLNIHEMTEEAAEDLLEYRSQVHQDDESEEEVDGAKENESELPRKIKGNVKRKREESEKSGKKKVRLNNKEKTSEETTVDLKVGEPMKSKGNVMKLKRKSKDVTPDSDSNLKIKKAPVVSGISKSKGPAETASESLAKSADPSDSIVKSGTEALLQHLAPHLVGPKKLKRRASCDAQIERTSVKSNESAESETSKSSVEKKTKKRKSLGWEEPLQEGEYEIFIPKSKILAQKKRLSDANDSLTLQTASSPKIKVMFPFHICSTLVSGSLVANRIL